MNNIIGQANDRMRVVFDVVERQVHVSVDGCYIGLAYAADREHAKLVAREWATALGYRWDGRVEV